MIGNFGDAVFEEEITKATAEYVLNKSQDMMDGIRIGK
jgi:hypothetical protein